MLLEVCGKLKAAPKYIGYDDGPRLPPRLRGLHADGH
jgi:hypothetical protein